MGHTVGGQSKSETFPTDSLAPDRAAEDPVRRMFAHGMCARPEGVYAPLPRHSCGSVLHGPELLVRRIIPVKH